MLTSMYHGKFSDKGGAGRYDTSLQAPCLEVAEEFLTVPLRLLARFDDVLLKMRQAAFGLSSMDKDP